MRAREAAAEPNRPDFTEEVTAGPKHPPKQDLQHAIPATGNHRGSGDDDHMQEVSRTEYHQSPGTSSMASECRPRRSSRPRWSRF